MNRRDRKLLAAAVQEGVAAALAGMGGPTRRLGTVQSVSSSNASVLVDGDTDPITAQVFTKLPTVADRVLVEFERGAVRIVGHQGGFA